MKYFQLSSSVCIVFLTFFLPLHNDAQTIAEDGKNLEPPRIKPYLNVGYITKLASDCPDCDKSSGVSIRVGILTKGRFGFYGGYLWYNVVNDAPDYDDSGSTVLLGADLAILEKSIFRWNFQAGIAIDKFKSVYHNSNKTEIETSIIPQLGFLFIIKKINTYVGMGGDHFNVGIGYTF